MAYTVTTKTSYGSRLKNSIGGVGMGLLLFVAGTVLLFWNEGRTVKTAKMLKEAEKVCVEMPDISAVNPEFSGQVVHATGLADTEEILSDPRFGVNVNAIKLIRNVEYYQVVESSKSTTKDKLGGGQETTTEYSYDFAWTDEPVDSKEFADPSERNDNHVIMTLEDLSLVSDKVTFGAYRLPGILTGQMNDEVSLPVESDTAAVKASLNLPKDCNVFISGSTVYIGKNPSNPNIGDLRITFSKVGKGQVSIIAKVVGDTFEAFTAKNGYSMATLSMGTHSSEEMFSAKREGNKTTAWILRLLGFLLIFIGLKMVVSIIETLFKVLPFLANIVGMGVNIAMFILALAWTLIVIAIGWIFYRPVLGILLLAAAVALIWFAANRKKPAAE
ncbi:MAG: TMEM43 family protein [Bacteroidales bacterium]|nr:TMEM43 family protein [Bacteroidales bacterium]